MGLKQDIVISNQFGSKSPGRYIMRYTSRTDANESLDINEYITKYTTRYSAVEQLKYNAPTENEIVSRDESLSRKDGVLFGNEGLSYTDDMLKEAATKTQNAADQGHVAMMPILSFSHDYLQKNNIVPEDMPEPTQAGAYKGQVDQLKLRQAVTDMMDTMHKDMGFTNPEWTGTIQLDTKHVHVHLTTIEKGEPQSKRMKLVKEKKEKVQPDMNWQTDDRTSPYTETYNERGFVTYERDNKTVATQKESKKGFPKFKTVSMPSEKMVQVENGMLNDKTKDRMRFNLNRSLTKKRDIKPFVKNIYDKRTLTKNMTRSTAFYNGVTAEKLQILQASLPDNKKMWRADSYAKSMQRPHEIANEIVDDLWTRHDNGVRLEDFDNAVTDYIDARQTDEGFDNDKRQELYQNAYTRLRKETINGLYRDMKELDDKDKRVEIPKYSIQATPTEALQNEIADMHERPPKMFDNMVRSEYRTRQYEKRFKNAYYDTNYYQNEVNKYDELNKQNLTTKESRVVRDYYMEEYKYNAKVSDKYAYMTMGKSSGVSESRFDEVKGSDLVNMLYDYGPKDDRSVPKQTADQYKRQTDARNKALSKTMDYLIRTGQYEQYEMLKEKRDDMRQEALIANQISSELQMPVPKRTSKASLETRKTIDTYQGRKMLKNEIYKIENCTKDLRMDYEAQTDFEKVPKRQSKKNNIKSSVDWKHTKSKEDILTNHANEYQIWTIRRLQFEQFKRDEERKRKEEEIEERLKQQELDRQKELEDAAAYEQEVEASMNNNVNPESEKEIESDFEKN